MNSLKKTASRLFLCVCTIALSTTLQAGARVKFIIAPTTATQVTLSPNKKKLIQYRITNNTELTKTLSMIHPPSYLSQLTENRENLCSNNFTLPPQGSCLLTLIIDGSKLPSTTWLNTPSPLFGTTYTASVTVCTDGSSYECSTTHSSSNIGITTTGETALPLLVAAGTYNNQATIAQTSSTDQQNYSTQTIAALPSGDSNIVAANCSGSYCAAVGGDMFAVSFNSGTTWTAQTNSVTVNPIYNFNAVSCTSMFCLATQSTSDSTYSGDVIYFVESVSTSAYPFTLSGTLTSTNPTSVSCNSNQYCMAAGGAPNVALLIKVQPNFTGTQYPQSSITALPSGSPYFYSISANPASGFFAALGAAGTTPFIAQTTNTGGSWGVITTTPSLSTYRLTSQKSGNLSCAGSGVCVASGLLDSYVNMAFAQTTNNGSSWSVSSLSPAITNGIIYAVSCSGDTTQETVCIAVGVNGTSPVVLQSLAGGTWSNVTPSSLSSLTGSLNSVSCTGDYPNTACSITGSNTSTSTPILTSMLYSISNGTTDISWFLQEGLPVERLVASASN
jgi:hypothetical protein